MRLGTIIVLTALVGCGGRTDTSRDHPGVPDAAADVIGGIDAFNSGDGGVDCTPDGVRLCGGVCGALPACPSCSALHEIDGSQSTYGVCWSDMVDLGNTPCALCGSGEGCVERRPGTFVCVPLAACAALRGLAAGRVCWYGDKLAYDGRAISAQSACPSDSTGIVCGGNCPQCANSTLNRCVGQGPDHPFGVCPVLASGGDPNDVGSFPICSLATDQTPAVACPDLTDYPYACAISPYPRGDQTVSRRNGYCLSTDLCKSLAGTLPGGLWCFDATGTRIAP